VVVVRELFVGVLLLVVRLYVSWLVVVRLVDVVVVIIISGLGISLIIMVGVVGLWLVLLMTVAVAAIVVRLRVLVVVVDILVVDGLFTNDFVHCLVAVILRLFLMVDDVLVDILVMGLLVTGLFVVGDMFVMRVVMVITVYVLMLFVDWGVAVLHVVVMLLVTSLHVVGGVVAVLMGLELSHPAGTGVVLHVMRLEQGMGFAVSSGLFSFSVMVLNWMVSSWAFSVMDLSLVMVLKGDKLLFVRNWGVLMGCSVVSNGSVGSSRARFMFLINVSIDAVINVSFLGGWLKISLGRSWGCFRFVVLGVRLKVLLPMVVVLVVLIVEMITVFMVVVVARPVPLERVRVFDVIF